MASIWWPSNDSKIISLLLTLNGKADAIMATLDGLKQAADDIARGVRDAITALNDLKAKLDAGGSVSQADLDAVQAQLQGAHDDLAAAVATDDPPAPPAG